MNLFLLQYILLMAQLTLFFRFVYFVLIGTLSEFKRIGPTERAFILTFFQQI